MHDKTWLRFTVISLFPELIHNYLSEALIAKALRKNLIQVKTVDLRQFASGSYKSVDEAPYGGGDGMLITADSLKQALQSIQASFKHVVYLSPQGQVLSHDFAKNKFVEWSEVLQSSTQSDFVNLENLLEKNESLNREIVLICGRYAGVDQRFIAQYVDEEISIGDFVLSGGELAALVLLETVSRFVPGVLGDAVSAQVDSFSEGWLEAPQFTRPAHWEGLAVPSVLISGDHQKIQKWKRFCSYLVTLKKRPDIFLKKWPQSGVSFLELRRFYDSLLESERVVLQIEDLNLKGIDL